MLTSDCPIPWESLLSPLLRRLLTTLAAQEWSMTWRTASFPCGSRTSTRLWSWDRCEPLSSTSSSHLSTLFCSCHPSPNVCVPDMGHSRRQNAWCSASFPGGLKNFPRSLDAHRSHVSEERLCEEPGNPTDKRKDKIRCWLKLNTTAL